MSDLGGSVPPKNERSSAFFADYLKKEIARWHPILRAAAQVSN
jgi:hypothetical protein